MTIPVSEKQVKLIRANPGCFMDWTVIDFGQTHHKQLIKPVRAACVRLCNGEWFQFESSTLVETTNSYNRTFYRTITHVYLAIRDPNDLMLLRLGGPPMTLNVVDSNILGIPAAKRQKY